MTNNNIDFATATRAELEAAGFKVTTKKSQAKTRRTKKSVWGVRPSANHASCGSTNVGSMTETGRKTVSN